MDIGSLIVAYIFISSGVYFAEIQKIKNDKKDSKDSRKDSETKPYAKSVFGRSLISVIILIVLNYGFLHWSGLAFFTISLILGFVSYDFVEFIKNPKLIIGLVPKVGSAINEAVEVAKLEKEKNEKEKTDKKE